MIVENRQQLKKPMCPMPSPKDPRYITSIQSSIDHRSLESVPDYVLPGGKIDWEKALRQNEKWMRSTIALRVGEQAAIDEVFQEVALAATSQKSPLRDVNKIGAWLYKLVILQSALYRRKAGRKRRLLKRYEESVVSLRGEMYSKDPLDWLLSKERTQLIHDALASLPAEERQILLMKYRDELSYHCIAEQLHTTDLAVQSKLHRARLRLKRIVIRLSNGSLEI